MERKMWLLLESFEILYPDLATDSPFGIWGRGWNTYPLHDGALLGLRFF